jgi:hypothetical protein
MDIRQIPMLAVLYLLAFLDRKHAATLAMTLSDQQAATSATPRSKACKKT